MSRSRSRLAADWFAKLRISLATSEVEHTDIVDEATGETLYALASAVPTFTLVGTVLTITTP
tara:strand:- start:243 stop:428 length:186 start_codon:yes stop_codon:yes gene_type:complete